MGVFSSQLSTKDLTRLCCSLSTSLDAGIPVLRALGLAGDHFPKVRDLLAEMSATIGSGASLESALRAQSRFFPPYFVEVVSAGERIGRSHHVFEALHRFFDEQLSLQRALWRQLTYPLCILVVGAVIIPFVQGYVIALLRPNARIDFFEYTWGFLRGWFPSLITFAAIVLLARFGAFRPVLQACTARVSFLGGYSRRFALARFLWILSLLLDSTVPMREAILRAAAATGNPWIERNLARAAHQVRQGAPLSEAFSTSRYLSPMMLQMLAVGEASGKLPEMLKKAAEYVVNETLHRARTLIRAINAILIVALGAAIVMGGL